MSKLQLGLLKVAAVCVGIVLLFSVSVFGFYWFNYKSIVDQRLTQPLFENTAKIYAAPREVRPGQKLTVNSVAQELRDAGYSEDGVGQQSPMGHFSDSGDSISIHPGPESYHSEDGATISFSNGVVSQIIGDGNVNLNAFELEPLLITGLSEEKSRTKRRLVTYDELPPNLVHAVISIEDRRFFDHGGVDYIRLLGAVKNDLTHRHTYMEGGSTLTMQLARGFFFRRKSASSASSSRSSSPTSWRAASRSSRSSRCMPMRFRWASREASPSTASARRRRPTSTKMFASSISPSAPCLRGWSRAPAGSIPTGIRSAPWNGATWCSTRWSIPASITRAQADAAKAEPLKLSPSGVNAGEAPYFVDLVREELTQKLGEGSFNSEGLRVYTSLDPDLQRAAAQAVEFGGKFVDDLVLKEHSHKNKDGTVTTNGDITYPQIALVALNPHTGQVLALVGGRNYGQSQLDHAVAKRPARVHLQALCLCQRLQYGGRRHQA